MYNREKTLLDELQNIRICLDENRSNHIDNDLQVFMFPRGLLYSLTLKCTLKSIHYNVWIYATSINTRSKTILILIKLKVLSSRND